MPPDPRSVADATNVLEQRTHSVLLIRGVTDYLGRFGNMDHTTYRAPSIYSEVPMVRGRWAHEPHPSRAGLCYRKHKDSIYPVNRHVWNFVKAGKKARRGAKSLTCQKALDVRHHTDQSARST